MSGRPKLQKHPILTDIKIGGVDGIGIGYTYTYK